MTVTERNTGVVQGDRHSLEIKAVSGLMSPLPSACVISKLPVGLALHICGMDGIPLSVSQPVTPTRPFPCCL